SARCHRAARPDRSRARARHEAEKGRSPSLPKPPASPSRGHRVSRVIHRVSFYINTVERVFSEAQARLGRRTLYRGAPLRRCRMPGELSAGRVVVEDATEASTLYNRSEEHTSELQSRFDLVCRL